MRTSRSTVKKGFPDEKNPAVCSQTPPDTSITRQRNSRWRWSRLFTQQSCWLCASHKHQLWSATLVKTVSCPDFWQLLRTHRNVVFFKAAAERLWINQELFPVAVQQWLSVLPPMSLEDATLDRTQAARYAAAPTTATVLWQRRHPSWVSPWHLQPLCPASTCRIYGQWCAHAEIRCLAYL